MPSRFERLRFTRAAQPAACWSLAAPRLAWIALVIWGLAFRWRS